MRIALISALLALFLPVSALPGAELLVIEQQDCPYCEKFDREIAEAYPKTTEGKKAPLRRLDLHQAWPEDLSNIRIERFTPTFVLVHGGQEVDRIRGYPGDIYFWFLLNEMLVQLKE